MPIFFIDTNVGTTRCADRAGTSFPDVDQAVRTAFAALLDIAHDEDALRGALDVVVCVREPGGTEVFRASLTTLKPRAVMRHAPSLSTADFQK